MSGPSSDPTGEPPEASGDEPTPPQGTPAQRSVPAWEPGPVDGGSSGSGTSGSSGYGTPTHGSPAHGSPAHGSPGQGTPAYGASGYGTPGYGAGGGPAGYGAGPGGPGGPGGSGGLPPRAPKPGIVPLRPLGLGEVLDGALGYIRAHPRIVLGASAILAVISQLLQVALQLFVASSVTDIGGSPDLAQVTGLLAGAGVTGLVLVAVTLVATAVLTGVLMVVISRSVLGAPVEPGEVWRAARPRVPGVLGLALIVALIGVGIIAVAVLPGALLLAVDGVLGGIVLFLGLVAGFVVVVWVSVSLSLATPAYVLEGVGVREALRRSWFLVSGRFWPVLGIQLLGALITAAVGIVITLPFQLIGTVLAGLTTGNADPTATSLPVLLLSAVGGIIATTLTTPFQSGVTGLLYVDQRMRREGFDIELQRAAAGGR